MAVTRKNSEMPSLPTTPDEIMEAMAAFGATEDNPMSLKEIASVVADTPEAVWAVLSAMEDEGTADLTGRHLNSSWWPVSEAPAKRTRRTKAQIAADNAESAKKNAYNARLAEGQDAVMSHAKAVPTPVMETTREEADKRRAEGVERLAATARQIFKPAPDALPKGTKITLESGAEATVIADEVITVKAQSMLAVLTAQIAATKLLRDDATNVRDGYEAPEEVTPPTRPQGVNENVWDAAHNAFGVSERDTWSARLWYLEKSLAQHEASLSA